MAFNTRAAYACAYKIFDEISTTNAHVTEIHVHGRDSWFPAPDENGPHTKWMKNSLPWWTGKDDAKKLTNAIKNVAKKHGYANATIATDDFSDACIDEYNRRTFTIALA